CLLAGLGLVEESVTEHAKGAILQNGVTKHAHRISMLVLPDERNLLLVHVCDSTGLDGSTVSALLIIDASPAAKVGLLVSHFDGLLLSSYRTLSLMYCFSALRSLR